MILRRAELKSRLVLESGGLTPRPLSTNLDPGSNFRQKHEFTRVLRAALSGSVAPAQHLSIMPGAGIPVRKAPACAPRAFQGLVRSSCLRCADCIGTGVDSYDSAAPCL